MESSTRTMEAPQAKAPAGQPAGSTGKDEDGPDVVDRVAREGVQRDALRSAEALEWFLSDEGEEDGPVTHPLDINVGRPGEERWIQWVVTAVQSTRIDELRRAHVQETGNRQQRRRRQAAEQLDVARFNAALVFEATISPDMTKVIQAKGLKQGASGADAIMWRFREKPLLIDQIAGEILRISGADEDDLREAREVIAAKN